jgi:hypothetical protein
VWGTNSYIAAGVIIGLPYETQASIQTAVDFFCRDDCPVDLANTFPLSIIGNHDMVKYMYMSEIDRNYNKYGYYFPNADTNYYRWSKDDNTDIHSYEQAEELSKQINPMLPRKLYQGCFYTSSFNHPVFKNRSKCLDMPYDQYKLMHDQTDFVNLFLSTVETDYFNPLIEQLKKSYK